MVTVLEDILPKSRVFCTFFVAKGLNAKHIHKEIFPVYDGKCLLHKAVHHWVTNISLMTKKLKRGCGSG
jgi:mannose-6-phosphate isomerase-like protein (cupin superfamily)